MIRRVGSASCLYRGTKGMVRKDEELCSISESAGDCETLRNNGKCPKGYK